VTKKKRLFFKLFQISPDQQPEHKGSIFGPPRVCRLRTQKTLLSLRRHPGIICCFTRLI